MLDQEVEDSHVVAQCPKKATRRVKDSAVWPLRKAWVPETQNGVGDKAHTVNGMETKSSEGSGAARAAGNAGGRDLHARQQSAGNR